MGIKILNSEKVFIIFSTALFGDVILCNSLCQNIKHFIPDSKVIMVVRKEYKDAALYQKDVDDVVVFDKDGEHKGFWGRIKFVLKFPYKQPYCSITSYYSKWDVRLSKEIGAKHIQSIKTREIDTWIQRRNVSLFEKLLGKSCIDFPNEYIVSKELPCHIKNVLKDNEKYIGLCTLSSRTVKDMPIDLACEIIRQINEKGYKTLFFGSGAASVEYSKNLKNRKSNFIDLTNKTTISELASVLKNCEALISVDTGVMHMGCAVKTPTVAVFYEEENIEWWAPRPEIYKSKIIFGDYRSELIVESALDLIK